MERLLTYWTKHYPTIDEDCLSFIRNRSTVKQYDKKQVIKLENERFPFFCIVLVGLVAGYRKNRSGKQVLCELMQQLDYFTGTQHPFTPRLREAEYIAAEKTTLLLIPIAEAREAQRRFRAFAELVHVMKQRKINFLELLIALDGEVQCYARYCVYMDRFGDVAVWLPPQIQWHILRMGKTSFYRVKGRHLRKK